MKTVYVDDSSRVTVVCPKCGKETNIDVTYFKDTHKKMRAKCPCGASFRLNLEFRQTY